VEKIDNMFNGFNTLHDYDKQTDRHTEAIAYTALVCSATHGKIERHATDGAINNPNTG